jgi:hypothetical protein
MNNYEVFLINKSTNTDLLHYLIQLAQNTKYFSMDTELDSKTNKPSLIQFEFIHEHLSTVVLVEVCHLPVHKQSLIFWLIRSIFKYIFQYGKIIYSWGDPVKELSKFLIYDLFSSYTLYEPERINLQDEFKKWHYQKYGFYAASGDLWGLQAAIADRFEQFLDKSQTLNTWSRGLQRHNNNKIQSMINYAVNDCLSVTKLAHHMVKIIVRI